MPGGTHGCAGPFHSPIGDDTSSTDFSGWHMSVAVRRRQARLAREGAQVDDQLPQPTHHPRPRPLVHPASVLLHGVAKVNAVDAARRGGNSPLQPPGVRLLRNYDSGCPRCQDGDGRHGCPPRCAWARVLARVADVASCDLLDFIEATGRACSLSTTSVNRRGPPSLPRAELGIQGPKSRGRNLSRKVRETRSSSSQKRSERGQAVLAYWPLAIILSPLATRPTPPAEN